jgi:hypothetical protein
MVLVGSEGVVESGGIINKIGTFQIGASEFEPGQTPFFFSHFFPLLFSFPVLMGLTTYPRFFNFFNGFLMGLTRSDGG